MEVYGIELALLLILSIELIMTNHFISMESTGQYEVEDVDVNITFLEPFPASL